MQYVFDYKDLNLCQRRLVKLLKYYNMSVLNHPGKKNVVAESLSRLSLSSVSHEEKDKKELVQNVLRLALLGVWLKDSTKGGVMIHNGSELSFMEDVKATQGLHLILVKLKEALHRKFVEDFSQWRDGILRYQGRSVFKMLMSYANKLCQ